VLPKFNADGNLPEGVHQTTEEEFLQRFGCGSARREWLAQRFVEMLSLVKTTDQLEEAFVWGSFVTGTELPNDIDVLLLMNPAFELEKLVGDTRVVFEHAAAKLRFQIDTFWAKSSIGQDSLRLWLDTYQTARDFKRRGIIQLGIK
jgi:hypothetical protein